MPAMLALVLLVTTLALADSVNPVTIVVAVYLASTRAPRRRLAAFATGVFTVYLLGGAAILFGPGELLRDSLHGARIPGLHVASLIAGLAAIALGAGLWLRRRRLGAAQLPARALAPGSAFALGAAVTTLDLPTALPYFGALAAITGSELAATGELALLVLFNLLYVLPLLAVLGAHALLGARIEPRLARLRGHAERLALPLLAALTAAAGVGLAAHGAHGMLSG